MVQVYQDVKLGSFTLNIPIDEKDLQDSIYIYSRKHAIAEKRPIITMDGDCFVVPRSYMPVSANSPSWGTGEYKMKVVLSEKCRYNPQNGRSKDWHRDYKQLVRMQNHGKAKNEYWKDIITTFRDNKNTILKATYTPLLTTGQSKLNEIITGQKTGTQASMFGGANGQSGMSAGGKTSIPGGSTPTGMPQGK